MPEEPEIEELPSGELVKVYPDGRKVLIRNSSPLKDQLDEANEDLKSEASALRAAQVDAIEAKLAAQVDGNEVPAEKSPI